ncbi:hypothetical protein H7F33_18785 [Pedobacter sp. PAMC26386]|nr:hypothetical protein H7F33_18785 [Pedobacter sp. PAMC26386]
MRNFTDSSKRAVFATKFVIEQNSPILHVYHFDDGCWQFSGKEKNLREDDFRVISLDNVLVIDQTLKELLGMPLGFEAIRASIGEKWRIISAN